MARLNKRNKPEPLPQTDANVGREIQRDNKEKNEQQTDRLQVGQHVQYWDEGWRYGTVDKLPLADETRYGEVRIRHNITGTVWIEGADIKPLDQEWSEYHEWRRG